MNNEEQEFFDDFYLSQRVNCISKKLYDILFEEINNIEKRFLKDKADPRAMCLCVAMDFINVVLSNPIFSYLNEKQRTQIAYSVCRNISPEDKKYNKNKHCILNIIKRII